MKRTHLAYLTIVLAVALLAIAFTRGIPRVHAQTGSPAQFSAAFTSGPLSSCPTPAAGTIYECSVTNVGLEESVNGSIYVPVNQPGIQGAQGPAGPAGPAGATGATGPQGPAGPVQSFGTVSCPTSTAGTGVVLGPGCKETTP